LFEPIGRSSNFSKECAGVELQSGMIVPTVIGMTVCLHNPDGDLSLDSPTQSVSIAVDHFCMGDPAGVRESPIVWSARSGCDCSGWNGDYGLWWGRLFSAGVGVFSRVWCSRR
jgi:hypothetical protein